MFNKNLLNTITHMIFSSYSYTNDFIKNTLKLYYLNKQTEILLGRNYKPKLIGLYSLQNKDEQ